MPIRRTSKWIAGCAIFLIIGIIGFLLAGIIGIFLLVSMLGTDEEIEFQGEYNITDIGEDEIPEEFIPIYKEAAEEYGIPWNLLAGVHRVETVFSTLDPMVSYVGAEGHFQFMPCTWVGWNHPTCSGLGEGNMTDDEKKDLDVIEQYGGYAVDANGDGKADMWDLEDAVYTAAHYLSESGASVGDDLGINEAILNYNHSVQYLAQVRGYMDKYATADTQDNSLPDVGSGNSGNDVIEDAISKGMEIVGKSPYKWGGGRNQIDIDNRLFDCSSFIRWAFDEGGGVQIDSVTSVTTDTLYSKGQNIDESDKKRGDLIFFDTYKYNGHIAIYLGDGDFLHDSGTNGVGVNNLSDSYWKDVYNGNVVRFVE